ncbi:SpoIIE family protein phosphatase [Streptomyces sp. TX20-6-3]|uniref:SpoIIE family protein phosphatase n=1 Tax=Streptomyces sp. TX20-6-3 TaxID=3028705 RepID=UPI0034DE4883
MDQRRASAPAPVRPRRDRTAADLARHAHAPLSVVRLPLHHSRLLPPGSILLLYTDGLVETRHGDVAENVERLGRLLTAAPVGTPLDTLLRSLHDAAAPTQAEDDTVLLAVRLPARGDGPVH